MHYFLIIAVLMLWSGRALQHSMLNDLVQWLGLGSIKELFGLYRSHGKWPDPWPWSLGNLAEAWFGMQHSRHHCLHIFSHQLAWTSPAPEETDAVRKASKYLSLSATYTFLSVAYEMSTKMSSVSSTSWVWAQQSGNKKYRGHKK